MKRRMGEVVEWASGWSELIPWVGSVGWRWMSLVGSVVLGWYWRWLARLVQKMALALVMASSVALAAVWFVALIAFSALAVVTVLAALVLAVPAALPLSAVAAEVGLQLKAPRLEH